MIAPVMIGDREVAPGRPTLLVAEAGFNHNGSVELALRLVDEAAAAGADAIKFQSFTVSELLHSSVSYRDLFEMACLDEEAHAQVVARCREKGILFSSTPFDERWVRVLDDLDADFLKVASMDLTTPTLLEAVAATGRPVVLSTGLSEIEETARGIEILSRAGAEEIVLLHCVSLYPTPPEKLNLRALRTMEEVFERPVGLSDHSEGPDAAVWAVAAGAVMIEKHFTVDKNLPGPDQKGSMDPAEFREMVRRVRAVEAALGDGTKDPDEAEQPLREKTRRGIYLRIPVKKGETLRAEHLRFVRPVTEGGLSASEVYEICGRRANRDMAEGETLRWSDLEKI